MGRPSGPTGGRDAPRTNPLSNIAATFTIFGLLASTFPSIASRNPGPRVPSMEALEGPASIAVTSCGGVARAARGVLQTPDFPKAFRVPLRCTWVVDASSGHAPGSSILVRLTQVFVAGGLRFESFTRLDMAPVPGWQPWWSGGRSRAGRIPSEGRQLIFDSDFGSSPPLEEVAWIRSASPYLVATLSIDSLEGSHIRDLGALLDVYGLNMTYEVVPPPPPDGAPKKGAGGRRRQGRGRGKGGGGVDGGCSLLVCSVAGHCLANRDLSRYHCSCFEGHFGNRCQYSRECDPLRNVSHCHNGGKCRHVGSTVIRCECPRGFYGPLCEGRRPILAWKDPESGADIGGGTGRRRKFKTEVAGTHGGTRDCPDCLGVQCLFDGMPESVCNCRSGYKVNKGDRWLFEGTFRIANFTDRMSARARGSPSIVLEKTLEKQLTRFLKKQNASRVSGVNIGSVSEDGEAPFSFLVGEGDDSKVRGALGRLVQEIQHLGEFTLSPDSLEIRQGPALVLLEVALDVGSVVAGGGFAASCVAQGSPAMEFRWYKDGALVDHTKASRHMWQRLLLDDRPDTYTAILRVTEASAPEDMGALWCHVSDGGRQQCGQVFVVEARGPRREAYVRPRASTILRGDNLTLACTSPASSVGEAAGGVVEFSWSKDGAPLTPTPRKEVVEPLYPSGSLLRIYDAQQSAIYACHVVANASSLRTLHPEKPLYTLLGEEGKHDSTAHVTVSNPEDPMCLQESSWGVAWPWTAVGQRAAIECPMGPLTAHPTTADDHIGHKNSLNGSPWGHLLMGNAWVPFQGFEVTRVCSDAAKWEEPDFSCCNYEPLRSLRKKFRKLTLGYLATSPEQTLQEMLDWLTSQGGQDSSEGGQSPEGPRDPPRSHPPQLPLLPGQIGSLLQLLEEVQSYIYDRAVDNRRTPGEMDMDALSYQLLKVLDVLLLKHWGSTIDPKESFLLTNLACQQSILWGHSLTPVALTPSVQYPTEDHSNTSMRDPASPSVALFIHLEAVSNSSTRIPRLGQSTPTWFSEQVEVIVSTQAPSADDVSGQQEEMARGALGGASADPGATLSPSLHPHAFLLSVVTFRSIRTQIPIAKQLRGHQWEYQLASHIVSVDLSPRSQLQKGHHQSFLKFSHEDGRGMWGGDPAMITRSPLNLTLHFTIEPQTMMGALEGRTACGHLTEGLRANTTELPIAWEVDPVLSPSSCSMVTCNFDHPGIYAAFVMRRQPGGPLGHESPTNLDERTTRGKGWWGVMMGEWRSGGGAILGLGFGTCFTLSFLALLRHTLVVTTSLRRNWKKTQADLPPAKGHSPSRQHEGDDAPCPPKPIASKKDLTEPKGQPLPLEFCLEMQCCVTVLITMGLFSYGSLMLSPQSSHPYIMVCLEGSLLIGMASLLGIVLIQYIEISTESRVASAPVSLICEGSGSAPGGTIRVYSKAAPQKTSSLHAHWLRHCSITKLQRLSQLRLIIVGITTGIPVLFVLVFHLIQRICSPGIEPSWWITINSFHFGIFVALASMITLLFAPLSACLLQQLNNNATLKELQVEEEVKEKETERTCITKRSIAILKRTVTIFSSMTAMETASVFYINFPVSLVVQCIFSISSLCLGVTIFLSYAVQSNGPSSSCKWPTSFLSLGEVGMGGSDPSFTMADQRTED